MMRRDFKKALMAGVVFWTAAAGLSSAFAQETAPPPRLLGNAATLQKLGPLADKLAARAGMDLLVIGKGDIDIDPYSNDIDSIKATFNRFASGFPGFPFERAKSYKVMISRASAQASPSAYPLPAKADAPACILVLPDMEETSAREIVSPIIGSAGNQMDTVPGSAEEWRLLTIGHELRHCRHSFEDMDDVKKQQYELEADQAGIDTYEALVDQIVPGVADKTAVPRALAQMRTINDIMGSYSAQYIMGGALHIPGETYPGTQDLPAIMKARKNVDVALRQAMGLPPDVMQLMNMAAMDTAARQLVAEKRFPENSIESVTLRRLATGLETMFKTQLSPSS